MADNLIDFQLRSPTKSLYLPHIATMADQQQPQQKTLAKSVQEKAQEIAYVLRVSRDPYMACHRH